MPVIPENLRDAFDAYSKGPAALRHALEGLTPPQLAHRPGFDDWSIRDVVMHLADAELVNAVRFRFVIGEESPPPLPGFDQAAWKRRLSYLFRDLDAALALFELTRHANAELLAQCDRAAWERSGVHSSDGTRSLADLLRGAVGHLDEHLAQVDALKAARN
jgi:hypothetical protein